MKKFAYSVPAGMSLAAALMMAPLSAQAADAYKLDTTHAVVAFKVSHLGFSTTYGNFDKVDGSMTFDEANPANSSVEVTIDTASIDSGYEKRDEHLRGEDFFNVAEYPTMTFKSTSIEVTGEDEAAITGDLTLLGETHPVTLHVDLNKQGAHPMDKSKTVAGFDAETEIDRTKWGMTSYAPAIGKEVEIILSTEWVKE